MRVFFSDQDRIRYLALLSECSKRWGMEFWAWCLMDNHVHILAVPKKIDSLARTFGEAHRRYTRMINSREGVRGHLFQERFFSCPIERDEHLFLVGRYVELNPVRAGMVGNPEDWPWSSAGFNLGVRRDDPLMLKSPFKGMVNSWHDILVGRESDLERRSIELHLRTGRPLGDIGWLKELEASIGRKLIAQRPGRPRRNK
jgi:putative transposase